MSIEIVELFKKVKDPREWNGKEYKLEHILTFSLLAAMSNAQTYKDVYLFIKVHFSRLKEIFGLKCRRYPTHSAIWKILTRVDPLEIERVFREHASKNESESGERKHICFDGKALRGSGSEAKGQKAVRVFEAFSKIDKIVLAHIPLGSEKDHEIQAFETFLQELDLKGKIVTADAMHCQKKLSS
jgi:hypothetical protein